MRWHDVKKKLRRRLTIIRLQPIRIFCFHQVSYSYQPQYGNEEDWMSTDHFKQIIMRLKKKYSFIPLSEALNHLMNDSFRFKRYAVLTCDDGYQSVLNVLSWLEKERVPIVLFLSAGFLDGKSYDPWFNNHWKSFENLRKEDILKDMYIHMNNLTEDSLCSKNVTVSLHGFGHDDVSKMSSEEFKQYVEKCVLILGTHPRYEPFYAYAWGRHSRQNDEVLINMGIVPVYCDGNDNWKYDGVIHRRLLGAS